MQRIATKPVAVFSKTVQKKEDESSNINDPFSFSPPNEFRIKLYARMNLFEIDKTNKSVDYKTNLSR